MQGPLAIYSAHFEVFCGMLARITHLADIFNDSRSLIKQVSACVCGVIECVLATVLHVCMRACVRVCAGGWVGYLGPLPLPQLHSGGMWQDPAGCLPPGTPWGFKYDGPWHSTACQAPLQRPHAAALVRNGRSQRVDPVRGVGRTVGNSQTRVLLCCLEQTKPTCAGSERYGRTAGNIQTRAS